MSKEKLSIGVRETFAERLNAMLDKRGFPEKGRASRLGEKYGVTTSAASAWLKGSIPQMDVLLQICRDFDCSVSWLTGSPGELSTLDPDTLGRAVHVVNTLLTKHNLATFVLPCQKMALLYALAYRRFHAGQSVTTDDLEDHIRMAV